MESPTKFILRMIGGGADGSSPETSTKLDRKHDFGSTRPKADSLQLRRLSASRLMRGHISEEEK